MVNILDGNPEIGAHMWGDFINLLCLGPLFPLTAVAIMNINIFSGPVDFHRIFFCINDNGYSVTG